jgi:energy-coupling factor transporter transmembrane protein EcfT
LNLKISKKEWILVAMVAVIAVLANLPEHLVTGFGLSVHYLVITLAAVVFIALLLYLRFTFFLIIILLVIGANLPGQFASNLNISKVPLILALALMVGVSLINHIVRLLPSGLEKDNSTEAQKALFYAVEKGNMVYAQKLLNMNLDPNVRGPSGYTPLMYSAAKGHAGLAELFLRNGADTTLVNEEGDSAVDLALRFGHSTVADLLKQARMQQIAQRGDKPSERGAFANA